MSLSLYGRDLIVKRAVRDDLRQLDLALKGCKQEAKE